jgi:hypothetical protein
VRAGLGAAGLIAAVAGVAVAALALTAGLALERRGVDVTMSDSGLKV